MLLEIISMYFQPFIKILLHNLLCIRLKQFDIREAYSSNVRNQNHRYFTIVANYDINQREDFVNLFTKSLCIFQDSFKEFFRSSDHGCHIT